MKTCKVRPSSGECNSCIDTSDFFNQTPNCGKCGYNTIRYELVGVVSGLFNDYALVQANGKIEKVSLGRVYDIREGE